MEQKAIKLSERFFETMVGRYAQAYRETGNVLSLVDTILEAITESIINSGISLKIKHDFECYFFDTSNIPNRLKISQTVEEDGMTPISFELKEGSNRFYISEKKIILEVKSGNNVRSVSLNMYINKYNPKYAIRFSTRNFGYENNIKSIPLYAAFCVK